jgi:hypothetical protein
MLKESILTFVQSNLSYVIFQNMGSLKYGHIRQMVTIYRYIYYEMHCEGKLKLKSHNTSCCLIEVVTKAGLTVT